MNLQNLDAIIFDFDGVLVESVDVKTRAFASLYEQYGEKIVAQVEDYHLHNGGISRFDKFRYFQTEILGGSPLDDSEVSKLAERFSAQVVDQVVSAPMVNGAQAFLDDCYGTQLLFVVSGTPTTELNEILERRNLQKYFSGTWGSPGSKTQNISAVLTEHSIRASHCVMIGDAIADYEGAIANAVPFLGRVAESDINLFSAETKTFVDFSNLPASWN